MKRLNILITLMLTLFVSVLFAQDSLVVITETGESFLDLILGGMSTTMFFVFLFYAMWGMVLNLLIDFVKRNPASKGSPEKVDFQYWWNDNKIRGLISLLCIPVAIIFCSSVFGMTIDGFIAFCIGFGSDHLIEILKKKNIVTNASTK